MAITSSVDRAPSIVRNTSGSYLDSAASPAAATITLGYNPKYFMWLNETDRISYEYYNGMTAGTTLKTVAAGTRTLDSGDVGITANGDGTVTIGASAILQNKQYRWEAH